MPLHAPSILVEKLQGMPRGSGEGPSSRTSEEDAQKTGAVHQEVSYNCHHSVCSRTNEVSTLHPLPG